MYRISEAENLKNQINNHYHYNKCFAWSVKYYYNDFISYSNKLDHHRYLYDNISSTERDII